MLSREDRRLFNEMLETMEGIYRAGAIDRSSWERFEKKALEALGELSPGEIRALRKREAASQAVFASHLGVTPGLVSQWERGTRKPQGSSLKLLNLVKRKGLAWIAV